MQTSTEYSSENRKLEMKYSHLKGIKADTKKKVCLSHTLEKCEKRFSINKLPMTRKCDF